MSRYGRVDHALNEARVPGSFFGRPWGQSAPPSRQASHPINHRVAYIGNVHDEYKKQAVQRAAKHLQRSSSSRGHGAQQAPKPKAKHYGTMRLDPITGAWVWTQ